MIEKMTAGQREAMLHALWRAAREAVQKHDLTPVILEVAHWEDLADDSRGGWLLPLQGDVTLQKAWREAPDDWKPET